MFKKLVASALYAGFAAGLIAAALQIAFVVPVILEAEKYETGVLTHFSGLANEHMAGVEVDHDDDVVMEEIAPLSRHALTILSTTASFIGFSLLLVVGFALAERSGQKISPRSGLIWGLAGFLAFHLLPAAGLAPELPGSAAADLVSRQIWWVVAVLFSVFGLALFAFGSNWSLWLIGAAMILAPHLIGAPQTLEFGGVVPPELASDFVGKALAVSAAGWVLLGLFAGHFWKREGAAG